MSLSYLWFGITRPTSELSMIAAVFKALGTGGVTVFVFMVYRDHTLVITLAVMVSMLDAGYIALLVWRRRRGRESVQAPTTNSAAIQPVDSGAASVST